MKTKADKPVLTKRSKAALFTDTDARAVSNLQAAPLYHQLYALLKSKIESGELPQGSLLPSEIELAKRFGTETSAAFVNGAGSLNINQVRGMKFEASAQGAGLIAIDRVEVDQFQLGLAGAASARLGHVGVAARAAVIDQTPW